jgi:hypothetical protein
MRAVDAGRVAPMVVVGVGRVSVVVNVVVEVVAVVVVGSGQSITLQGAVMYRSGQERPPLAGSWVMMRRSTSTPPPQDREHVH